MSASAEFDEVSRLIGYPSPERMSEPVREMCLQQLVRLPSLCEPWGTWRDFELRSAHQDGIELAGGLQLISRRLAKLMRKARTMRLFVATLGEAVSREIQHLVHDACMLEAMVLDAAATAAVHALTENLIRRTCDEVQQRGLGTTTRYAPGYTGWNIGDIGVLFATLECEHMPVQLNAQLMMRPEKSLLSIVGLTDDGHIAAPLEQCRGCDLIHCSARKAPYLPRPRRGLSPLRNTCP
ncbi:hypothetical protein ACG33_12650 [Steroidobacter denitrificans]|uniref:AdoMet activation domain-containing protein n=2 Tax=Steroidobacter denitrificans TaxID=465721 RepID=A0A127FBZ7_STEDE|nr:hypothetical protein ACG33_12650 [Steroidobacter denitrificans]